MSTSITKNNKNKDKSKSKGKSKSKTKSEKERKDKIVEMFLDLKREDREHIINTLEKSNLSLEQIEDLFVEPLLYGQNNVTSSNNSTNLRKFAGVY